MQARGARRIATLTVVAGMGALPLLLPAPSRGGAVLRDLDLTIGNPTCPGIALCGSAEPCTDARTMCVDFPALGSNCVRPGQDLYCCASAACPTIAGEVATCVPVDNPETGALLSVCVYSSFELCDPTLTVARVRACFTDPSGILVSNWAAGNCDGDMLPNGTDPDPCTPPISMPDGGMPPGDGGGMPIDAALGNDGGQARDAGARDAGVRDAAGPDARTTSARSRAVTFRGGGGCVCSAPGA